MNLLWQTEAHTRSSYLNAGGRWVRETTLTIYSFAECAAGQNSKPKFWKTCSHYWMEKALDAQKVKENELLQVNFKCAVNDLKFLITWLLCFYPEYTGLFISPSGISELCSAITKTDTAERSISTDRETLQVCNASSWRTCGFYC
jgi:hypothetical protein